VLLPSSRTTAHCRPVAFLAVRQIADDARLDQRADHDAQSRDETAVGCPTRRWPDSRNGSPEIGISTPAPKRATIDGAMCSVVWVKKSSSDHLRYVSGAMCVRLGFGCETLLL
jgi:hypothetical protein